MTNSDRVCHRFVVLLFVFLSWSSIFLMWLNVTVLHNPRFCVISE